MAAPSRAVLTQVDGNAPVTRAYLRQALADFTCDLFRSLAQHKNEKARAHNDTVLRAVTRSLHQRLKPLYRVAGDNAGSIGLRPHFFPKKMSDCAHLTRAEIARLANYYGEDFGMLATDDLAAKRQKFIAYITEEPKDPAAAN